MSWVESWWDWGVHVTWQASLLAVIVMLVVRYGRRWPSSLRYALLGLAVVKFLLPPFLDAPTGVFSRIEVASRGSSSTSEVGDASVGDPRDLDGATIPAPRARRAAGSSSRDASAGAELAVGEAGAGDPSPIVPYEGDAATLAGAESTGDDAFDAATWRGLLVRLHLGGAAVFAALAAARAMQLLLLRRRASRVRRGPLHDRLRALSRRVGLRRVPQLLVSDEVEAPISCGLLRPAVVLPSAVLQRLEPRQQDAVLAHELVHQRHGDVWINAIQIGVVALWWFNPIAWWLARELRSVREDCCDDALLGRGLASDDLYCETLLRVAAELRGRSRLGTAVAMAHGEHALARRFRRIMDPRLRREGSVPMTLRCLIPALALIVWPGARWTTAAAEPTSVMESESGAALLGAADDPVEIVEAEPPVPDPAAQLRPDDEVTRFVVSQRAWSEKRQQRDGRIQFAGLAEWLEQAHTLAPDAEVLVVAPRAAPTRDLVAILDQVSIAGFRKVSVSQEPQKNEQTPPPEEIEVVEEEPPEEIEEIIEEEPPEEIEEVEEIIEETEELPEEIIEEIEEEPAETDRRATQRAVEQGLRFLRAHQWDSGVFDDAKADTWKGQDGAVLLHNTALATLAFLGCGNTAETGPHAGAVARAVEALIRAQDPTSGRFTQAPIEVDGGYLEMEAHAHATRALAEAHLLGGEADERLRSAAQAAVDRLLRARNPYAGWRYDDPPSGDNDSTVTTACLYALFAARDAGLIVDEAALDQAMRYLDSLTDERTGRTGFYARGSRVARTVEGVSKWPADKSEANTAMTLLMRVFAAGQESQDQTFQRGLGLLERQLPRWDPDDGSIDFTYWHYGAYVAFQKGGRVWDRWQQAVIPALTRHQTPAGHWSPSLDPWGAVWGSIYTTAINVMTLQVQYRYARMLEG